MILAVEIDVQEFLDVGLLGVIFLLVVAGRWLRLEREVTERDKRIEELIGEVATRDEKLAAYQTKMEDNILPLTIRAVDVLERASKRGRGGAA